MQGTKVILGTYNTMPDGASSKVFELTYQSSWRPFLSSLYKFQNIFAVLYYSGTVLQWIEENHPEFLILLEEMAGRRQIELLGGGFFSPLLSALQPSDKVGQIEMLTTYLRKAFGKRPSGGWLYEYSWDASLPLIFRNSGFEYSFLPANKLKEAGMLGDGLYMPLVTEDQRKLLYIFPVFDLDEEFELPMPFESALERLMASTPDCRLYTMMIDSHSVPGMWEAFGLESPDVMFEKTFAWFQKNCLDIETTTAQSYAKSLRAGQLFYLSSCASSRLCACVEKPDEAAVHHGMPPVARQLILQNPSSKRLYDKMYYVHTLMTLLKGDKARKKSAQEDLWKAQNGDAYWEGCLGGIRRPEVRMNAYRSLIEAEKTTRVHGSFAPGIILDDIDCDGEREIIYQASDMNCYIHCRGAAVFELDSFKSKQNYCCSYSPGKAASTNSFIDRIFEFGSFEKELLNLGSQVYSVNDRDRNIERVVFGKEFPLRSGSSLHSLALKKSFIFQKHCVSVDVELTNRSQNGVSLRFVSEINLQPAGVSDDVDFFAVMGHDTQKIAVQAQPFQTMAEAAVIEGLQNKEIIEIRSDKPFCLHMKHSFDNFSTPELVRLRHIEGSGFTAAKGEIFYQGTAMLFGWDVQIPPDSAKVFSLSLHLHS